MVLSRKKEFVDSFSNNYISTILDGLKWEDIDRQDHKIHQITPIAELRRTHVFLEYFLKEKEFEFSEWLYKTDSKRIERTHKTKKRPETFKEKFFHG